MKRLRACDGCKRHVFVSERECPFCHLQLTAAAAPVDVSVPSGASRAQRLALAAALGGQGLIGCAQTAVPVYGAPVAASPSVPAGGNTASTAGKGGGQVAVPVYGAPLAGQAAPVKPPARQDAGVTTPVYGAPLAGQPAPRPDAGHSDEDAGPADAGHADAGTDAGPQRDGGPMVHPLYGAPAPAYGLPPAPAKN